MRAGCGGAGVRAAAWRGDTGWDMNRDGEEGMSSRERLLAAIDGAAGAPIACSFMMFRALRDRCRDEYEFASREMEMGLDCCVRIEDFPVRFAPEVRVSEWVEEAAGGGPPIIHRAYETPAGRLTASVSRIEGWPYGDRLPIFGDYITPRAVKHLVTGPSDLEALRFLLAAPEEEDIRSFREAAAERKRFADDLGLLLGGGWKSSRSVLGEDKQLIGDDYRTGCVIDALMWLCGGTEPLLWAYDEPEFLEELIGVIADWDCRRLEAHLDVGVDIVFRRGWYEGTEFWSPGLYRRFILPSLRREVELAHQAGVRCGYIITSGTAAIADLILESGVDAIVGIDPGEGKGTSLGNVRESFGGKTGLWGGVSGPLIVEKGSEAEVRGAVEEAISELGGTGRFVLSPVDNVRADTDRSWRNVQVLIDTWKALA